MARKRPQWRKKEKRGLPPAAHDNALAETINELFKAEGSAQWPAKAFDLVLAEGLWWEWRERGVDVVALCPGNTATPGLLSNKPRIDSSAFADPADVAREALDHLLVAREQGPICIPGAYNRSVRAAFDKLPRRQVVEIIGAITKKMITG